jgi:hypothetical protein
VRDRGVQVDGRLLAVAGGRRLRRPAVQPRGQRHHRVLARCAGVEALTDLLELGTDLHPGSPVRHRCPGRLHVGVLQRRANRLDPEAALVLVEVVDDHLPARVAGSRRPSIAIRFARSRSSSGYFLGAAMNLIHRSRCPMVTDERRINSQGRFESSRGSPALDLVPSGSRGMGRHPSDEHQRTPRRCPVSRPQWHFGAVHPRHPLAAIGTTPVVESRHRLMLRRYGLSIAVPFGAGLSHLGRNHIVTTAC